MNENPYAAPPTNAYETASSGAEATRRLYIRHEASVKSIGTLFMLGSLVLIPLGLFLGTGAITAMIEGDDVASIAFMLGISAAYLVLGFAQAATAFGLRSLQPWSRIVASVLAAIGLIGFPIGTLLGVYFLYLLLSKRGTYVFTEEYKQVIAETPYIKYRTSILLIVLLILLVLLMFVGVGAFLLGT